MVVLKRKKAIQAQFPPVTQVIVKWKIGAETLVEGFYDKKVEKFVKRQEQQDKTFGKSARSAHTADIVIQLGTLSGVFTSPSSCLEAQRKKETTKTNVRLKRPWWTTFLFSQDQP